MRSKRFSTISSDTRPSGNIRASCARSKACCSSASTRWGARRDARGGALARVGGATHRPSACRGRIAPRQRNNARAEWRHGAVARRRGAARPQPCRGYRALGRFNRRPNRACGLHIGAGRRANGAHSLTKRFSCRDNTRVCHDLYADLGRHARPRQRHGGRRAFRDRGADRDPRGGAGVTPLLLLALALAASGGADTLLVELRLVETGDARVVEAVLTPDSTLYIPASELAALLGAPVAPAPYVSLADVGHAWPTLRLTWQVRALRVLIEDPARVLPATRAFFASVERQGRGAPSFAALRSGPFGAVALDDSG